MIYDTILRISYIYAGTASGGRHLARLLPLDLPAEQRLILGHLDITPEPAERLDRIDFFGNNAVEFAFRSPHKDIVLRVHARVDRLATGALPARSCRLPDLPRDVDACRDLGATSPLHYIAPSARVPLLDATTAYARAQLAPDMTTLDAVIAIGTALHRDMRFDPKATTVETPMAEAFANKHGVCQDFSHVMIACLRGLGIPSGYVSGFLRTQPPPGQARLEGADAMHAWVRAWCGTQAGWVEFDPTNAVTAGQNHIVVARGRDYHDVSPVKGILRAAGGQRSEQAVDVIPLTER
jgi:transglutaminase-like putative cysteine protease